MHRKRQYILTLLFSLLSLHAAAQQIRYVTKNGAYTNDGKSWATAKHNIQDAINDLVDNGLTGEVWVAKGTYTPTESTESSGGSSLYMSFKIPAGVKVYGGFAGTEATKDQRPLADHRSIGSFYSNETILSGDFSSPPEFEWNASKKLWDAVFYGNSYHVVWFATNGFDAQGRAKPLSGEALLEGCVVQGGNAHNTATAGRYHNAYGGGIYMVEGAVVRNCFVRRCSASRDGGGVYMDGGGLMDHCYIAETQALGLGMQYGYGGGVCLDANRSTTAFGLKHCAIVNSVGRMGGGMAVKVGHLTAADGTDIRYKPYASAVLVANNTATTEGGGVYMLRGGAVTQMTIVNNQCNGTGITANGMVTGRAAGLYCRDNAYVANSVLWGGACAVNTNIQYASSRSANSESLKADMRYCALSMSDYVDWSGTRKVNVSSLSSYNDAATEAAAGGGVSASAGYPLFENPSEAKGHLDNGATALAATYLFKPKPRSTLANAGLLTVEWDADGRLPFGQEAHDIAGKRFNPRATLGAYTPDPVAIAPQTTGSEVNFYVDESADKGMDATTVGGSWDAPARFLSNVTHFIGQHAAEYAGKTVNVYVKEGSVDNTNSFREGRVRTIGIDIPSRVNLYGGYPARLTGTHLEQTIDGVAYRRNPILHPTVITGRITGEYENNVAHLVRLEGCSNVLIDGFQVRNGNAFSTRFANDDKNGAGLLFHNVANVRVRNTLIAGCTAEQGAAVYATGTSKVSFENCIIHNNASPNLRGIVYSESSSQLTFDHCNFLRNVGHVGYIRDGAASTQVYHNSIFFANMNEAVANTNQAAGGGIDKCLPAFAGNTANFSGNYCMFDRKSAGFSPQFGGNNLGQWQYDLQYDFSLAGGEGYPRFINPTKNTGVSPDGDATFNGRATSFEPHNDNPVVNAASHTGPHTGWGTDMSGVTTRDYGGLPDIGAVENHRASRLEEGQNAYTTGQPAYGGVTYVRDYNTYKADGSLDTADNAVAHHDGTQRDGSSWRNAINGNATYQTTGTQDSYTLATPTASVLTSPVPFKLGMLFQNTPGNTVYFAKNKGGNGMNNTTDAASGDDFILMATGTEHLYHIYNLTQQKYTYYTDTSNGAGKVKLKDGHDGNTKWYLYPVNTAADHKTYIIIPEALGNNQSAQSWNYYGAIGNDLGLYPGYNDGNGKWQFFSRQTVAATVSKNGFQHALDNAHATFLDSGEEQKVWVGAGKYATRLTMREGASAFGGFPATGNPGEDERNISNQDAAYMTVVDGQADGRVLTQPKAFAQTTTFEGFTLRNGASTGTEYGAGAFLRAGGVVKNCLIENNRFKADASTADRQGGGGLYLNAGSLIKNSVVRDNHIDTNGRRIYCGGAGVFSAGGTLQNSLIVENDVMGADYNILGAGMYISDRSELYNCTIAYNYGDPKGSKPAAGGVWDNAAKHVGGGKYENQSLFYNCIMWGNYAKGRTMENMIQVGMAGFNAGAGKTNDAFFTCYSSAVNATYASDVATDPNKVRLTNTPAQANAWQAFLDACKTNEPFVRAADGTTTYALKATATQCINKGSKEDVLLAKDITEDIAGSDRVQDCTVDKGAYEYNDAFAISPDLSQSGMAAFYVTPKGRGTASAENPANAACAAKLQRVIDAAGRYKYQHPTSRVVVKVANSHELENQTPAAPFKYYATRTTDDTDQDVRVWSVIVPRGVEVWGGYTDTYTDADDNGFYKKNGTTYTDNRDVTGHPTYFDSYYYNKHQKNGANVYHVVTFTDKVFDADGKPYLAGDAIGSGSSYTGSGTTYMLMSTQTQDRAVVDGIYITGGNANLQVTKSGVEDRNVNQYGGAAIVTDYAHVRNCVLRDNQGIYGGALALTHNALVSGCLIDRNTADYGGAVYVFEHGTRLSDGTVVSTEATSGEPIDKRMARVYTSTIVNNKANTQGGGIWFSQDNSNVRVNSSVIWQNASQDQANVSGLSNPDKPDGDVNSSLAFYPFAYCAAQNIRLAGTNNIYLNNLNRMGARFAKAGSSDGKTLAVEGSGSDFTKYDDFGHYGLTSYSILARTGMPVTDYNSLKSLGLADADFTKTDRLVGAVRSFVDIGARAIDKRIATDIAMLRLFVASPEDIDMNAVEDMMKINTLEGSTGYDANQAYYAQEGSSFAYPMQSVQAALDYIRAQRTVKPDGTLATPDANNLPFEICIARGTYHPTTDLTGKNGFSLGNTFVLPEGVTLIGGFDCNEAVKEDGSAAGDNNFYGRYHVKGTIKTPVTGQTYYIEGNTDHLTDATVQIVGRRGTYTMHQLPLKTMADARKRSDINANNIVEPWEFTNQTVLSGNADNVRNTGVFHVLSVYPDQTLTGALPLRSLDYSTTTYKPQGSEGYGTTDHEEGQPITLDGLTVTGGYARTYMPDAIADNGKFNYYHGGGLLIDGKRYCDDYNNKTNKGTVYQHAGVSNAVAYRDIPVVITRCKFEDNRAGYGAAISSNTTVDIFNSTFEHNKAESGKDLNVDYLGQHYDVSYPGVGGAIYATHQLSAFNTIFANNEAADAALEAKVMDFNSLRNQAPSATAAQPNRVVGGSGGAVFVGRYGQFHLVNCNFVRNRANAYPAVFTLNPNAYPAGADNYHTPQYNQLTNSLFWGNEVNDAMMRKWLLNEHFRFASQLICNFGKANRTTPYEPLFEAGVSPKNQTELDDYQETAWFSAYEADRGLTPVNRADLRNSDYTPLRHVMAQLKDANAGNYQNCNVALAVDNEAEDGPNFVNPSAEAGYDGYTESADWSPSRANILTDNGSGGMQQKVTELSGQYKAQFAKYEHTTDVPAGRSSYSLETTGDYKTTGAYTTTRYLRDYVNYNRQLPLGDDSYMMSAYVQADGNRQKLLRISSDPNPMRDRTYIDIGVYEYPHTALQYQTMGDEVDILWVSPVEKPDNGIPDGSTWDRPTSDLQRAIEILLSSRNGHRKEIRLMNGTFTPLYTINDHVAFYIDTKYLNNAATMPLDAAGQSVTGLGVKSLTIKGGYSRDLNNVYDVDEYPAVIRQQNRTDYTSDRWNHLIYINDATQRYGKPAYDDDNGHGWGSKNNPEVHTIPIEIDGVKLVNSQAKAGVKGAVVYYADQTFDAAFRRTDTSPTYIATTTTPANVAKITYYKDEAMTEVSDVPTMYYKRDDTKYYTDATYQTESPTPTAYVRYGYTEKTQPAKLIMSKTVVMGSGSPNHTTTSAVYIGKNGGHVLLYNNVMHSNYGQPLVTEGPALSVNNTFALNGGAVEMGDDATDKSAIYNCVFWRNNPTTGHSYGEQFKLQGFTSVTASGDIFKRNAFTGGETTYTDYEVGQLVANHYNVGLSDNNTDVIDGPNFTNPLDADLEKRDFTIKPSLRLLNKGDNALYNDNLSTTYNIYDLAWLTTTRHDAGNRPRVRSHIDLGAHEYQNNLERVIYVNPNATMAGQGNSWADPLPYGGLQTAVDLAAVYHVNTPQKEAYVFVKGAASTNASLHTGETLLLRNGVSVYGGISPSFTTDCEKTDHGGGNYDFAETTLETYVENIRADRGGVASPTGNKTTVSAIRVPEHTTFDTHPGITAVADGFYVTATTAANPTGASDQPVIDVQPRTAGARVALRNIIVAGNNTSAKSGTHVAVIDNALVYEALFRDNTAPDDAAVLKLGTNGYAVNITATGKTIGADGTSPLNGGTEAASHVYNSLVNYAGTPATEHSLSGHSYPVADQNLNYQLAERSQHIDESTATNPLGGVAALKDFINYATDRDLLGNPRLLNGVSSQNKIDRGAFETWRVDCPVVTTATTGGFYPHDGSVVYIMENNSLVSNNSLVPAYLLVQKGAGLYGNGHAVKAAYVGVERMVRPDGVILGMPYAMRYAADVALPTYDSDHVLTLTPDTGQAYRYNGQTRSAWNKVFKTADSEDWGAPLTATDLTAACAGVRYHAGATTETLMRFTGKGASMTDYIYTEEAGAIYKTVTLVQHDDRTSTDGGADFTSKEDMGWNCFTLPYLVSGYSTMARETLSGNGLHNMHIPHTLWLYYDGLHHPDGTTSADGGAGYYSVSSWKNDDWHLPAGENPVVWLGEGIFTQTAAIAEEQLLFHRPVLPSSSPAKGSWLMQQRFRQAEGMEVAPTAVVVTSRGRTIDIAGLAGGENIAIYDVAGRLCNRGRALGNRYSAVLPGQGMYIIRVDALVKKLMVK